MNPPAFQLYASDFLAATSEMTAEEVGVYFRLLLHQWIKGGIPDDDNRLMAMAGQCQASSLAYAKTKFGFTCGLIGFFGLCGFLAVPLAMSAIGWTLVVLVMRGNSKR